MLFGFSVMFLLTISDIIVITPSVSNLAAYAQVNKDVTASDDESLQYVIYENSTFGIRIEFPTQFCIPKGITPQVSGRHLKSGQFEEVKFISYNTTLLQIILKGISQSRKK